MANCIIFYGNSDIPGSPKTAGPFRIATELRKHGYTVMCIDITVFNGFDDEFKKIYSSFVSEDTLWTGISGTFLRDIFGKPQMPTLIQHKEYSRDPDCLDKGVYEFVEYAKSLNPNMKLLLGGARLHRLSNFGFVTFEKYVDKEIVEYTDFLSKKPGKRNLKYLSNVIEGQEFEDFVTSQIVYDKNDIIFENDTLPLEVARGCIFRCKFCSYPLNGKKKGEWIKHANSLREELIRNYEEFGVTNYAFSDDTYNDSLDKIKMLRDEVFTKLPFQIKWSSYIRLDLMVRFPEMVDVLKDSGIKSAVCAIESLNPRSAKAIGKGLDPQLQIEFVREIKKDKWKDVLISSNFILGLPYDSKEYIDEFEQWILGDQNPFDYWYIFPLGIFPKGQSKSYTVSEFDLEYEKYGYEMIRDPSDLTYLNIGWKNSRTGLNTQYCAIRARQILEKSKKTNWKLSGWLWAILQEFVPDEYITSHSRRECYKKFNIEELQRNKIEKYKSELHRIADQQRPIK
jgi:radical SAM superfamily enzyme YgiQ (UPF0313 family)